MAAEWLPDNPSIHRIIAIDPGVTTGICHGLLNVDEASLELTPSQGQFNMSGFFECLRNHVSRAEGNIHVVYETFQYRNNPRKGLDLTPVKLIGITELLAEWYSDQDVTFYGQNASMGKGFYDNTKLKAMGLYKSSVPHGLDAMRHLLHWLAFREGSQYADIQKLEVKLAN